jgi:hypothetical protein
LTSELEHYQYDFSRDEQDVEAYVFTSVQGLEKTVAWGSGVLPFTNVSLLRIVDRNGEISIVEDGSTGDLDGMVNQQITLQITVEPVFIREY